MHSRIILAGALAGFLISAPALADDVLDGIAKMPGGVEDVRIVLGAVASRPHASPAAEALLRGQVLTDEAIAAAAEAAYAVAKPMDNTDYELIWRKKMVRALVSYALLEVRGDDVRALRLKIARQLL